MAHRLLAIYLNDHLAGAAAGVELARRARGANEGDETFGEPLAGLCAEVEADRQVLVDLTAELGIRRDRFKPAAAWMVEKLGRLKPNGQLTGYSPLSRLVELEMLLIGVTGKAGMWRALVETFGGRHGAFDFEQLGARTEVQRDLLRGLHKRAAAQAFAGVNDGAGASLSSSAP